MGQGSKFQEGFNAGVQFGGKVENRVAVEAIANSLLTVMGKDAGDGVIDLGAAGRWAFDSREGRWLEALIWR